ncbi:DUF1659 domain-containing protein [Clostridium chromiireducens]|uniref:DUF1659 domain-containing protein n=1 Tax=Clostridium chromiireducens TaxID=225345 RepID=A0A1V4IFE4_9CLOT|nr:DUF1659 domain-containing protein [Clostridium chromiireducens]OPJ58656.1 hypothetical protein CLCHR_37750 [Clostridium chromiireducens]RII33662.1 DUF1659 domain-containing protein [Clostridium chromiireducens]
MAITKVPESTALSIEIQSSIDKAGDPVYTKKTFSGVKNDIDPQSAYDVAEAIKAVLAASTRDTFINSTVSLINA